MTSILITYFIPEFCRNPLRFCFPSPNANSLPFEILTFYYIGLHVTLLAARLLKLLRSVVGNAVPPSAFARVERSHEKSSGKTRQMEKARQSTPATSSAANGGKTLLGWQRHAQPDPIWHIDDEGICVEVAPGIGATSSPLAENDVPSKVHDLLPTHAGRLLLSLVRKAIAAGAAQIGEPEFAVNGRNALCQVQVVPYTERGALTVLHDISERIRTEKELRRSQRQLRKLADHLQTAREEERTRIAREIHDQMGQALSAFE